METVKLVLGENVKNKTLETSKETWIHYPKLIQGKDNINSTKQDSEDADHESTQLYEK